MAFETQIRDLATKASIKIYEADYRYAKLIFTMKSQRNQALWILPFGDMWEFSVQSAITFDKLDSFPQWLLATLLSQNSKNKRAYWCIEKLSGKFTLSAMVNFPSSDLSSSEFHSICWALVSEVEALEQAFLSAINQRVK